METAHGFFPPRTATGRARLYDAPTDELARLEVHEMIGAYYRQVGAVGNGGRRLAAATPDASPKDVGRDP
jgi:hypothetical protein